MIRHSSLSRPAGRNPAGPLVVAETSPDAQPPASGDKPSRVFWAAGRSILFRDDRGVRPVNIIRVRCIRHALWRMARDARGAERVKLCTLYAEATEAIKDVMAVRLAVMP